MRSLRLASILADIRYEKIEKSQSVKLLQYNVCHECRGGKSKGSAGKYGEKCAKQSKGESINHCGSNVKKVSNAIQYDFIGLQETDENFTKYVCDVRYNSLTHKFASVLYNKDKWFPEMTATVVRSDALNSTRLRKTPTFSRHSSNMTDVYITNNEIVYVLSPAIQDAQNQYKYVLHENGGGFIDVSYLRNERLSSVQGLVTTIDGRNCKGRPFIGCVFRLKEGYDGEHKRVLVVSCHGPHYDKYRRSDILKNFDKIHDIQKIHAVFVMGDFNTPIKTSFEWHSFTLQASTALLQNAATCCITPKSGQLPTYKLMYDEVFGSTVCTKTATWGSDQPDVPELLLKQSQPNILLPNNTSDHAPVATRWTLS